MTLTIFQIIFFGIIGFLAGIGINRLWREFSAYKNSGKEKQERPKCHKKSSLPVFGKRNPTPK